MKSETVTFYVGGGRRETFKVKEISGVMFLTPTISRLLFQGLHFRDIECDSETARMYIKWAQL